MPLAARERPVERREHYCSDWYSDNRPTTRSLRYQYENRLERAYHRIQDWWSGLKYWTSENDRRVPHLVLLLLTRCVVPMAAP